MSSWRHRKPVCSGNIFKLHCSYVTFKFKWLMLTRLWLGCTTYTLATAARVLLPMWVKFVFLTKTRQRWNVMLTLKLKKKLLPVRGNSNLLKESVNLLTLGVRCLIHMGLPCIETSHHEGYLHTSVLIWYLYFAFLVQHKFPIVLWCGFLLVETVRKTKNKGEPQN